MKHNPEVHHRRSIRLSAYACASTGAYYVTICTYEKECIFEDPAIRAMIEQSWFAIFRRSKGMRAYEFAVMPNHIHGIIWITRPNAVGAQHTPLHGDRAIVGGVSGPEPIRGSVGAAPLRPAAGRTFRVVPGSIGAIIGAFKSATAKRVNTLRRTPSARVWQRNYYEHIVRNEGDLRRVREYIRDNPWKWA